jgi:lysophospholipase L1-like esterase
MPFNHFHHYIVCAVFLLFYTCVDTRNTNSEANGNNTSMAAIASTPASKTSNTVDFSSAVLLAASLSWQHEQLASIPAIPMPTNVTDMPDYAAARQLAPVMPPLQAGVTFSDAERMVADLIAHSTGKALAERQAALRVMIVGDSMTQGQEGDWTWRYRMWQWFEQNGIAVEFVGPYVGTVPPPPASPPSPPPLYGSPSSSTPAATNGGYAKGVDAAFLSNCNHFSLWGRPMAVAKGLIQGVLEQTEADLVLLMLGFNDLGWFYSDANGLVSSTSTFVSSARAANPNLKFAIANVPQRSFIGGRDDLVEGTNIYNDLLPGAIAEWSTDQSPIHLVELEQNYDCQPGGCLAGKRRQHHRFAPIADAGGVSQATMVSIRMPGASFKSQARFLKLLSTTSRSGRLRLQYLARATQVL